MTKSEAVDLVIQAGSMGKGGDVFVIPTGGTHVGVNASLHERYFITFTSFT